jgi:hypothetical protein
MFSRLLISLRLRVLAFAWRADDQGDEKGVMEGVGVSEGVGGVKLAVGVKVLVG